MKEREIQLLQAKLEARTKELSEKTEQIQQQVRKVTKSRRMVYIRGICPAMTEEHLQCFEGGDTTI